jgi:hypothetical protein
MTVTSPSSADCARTSKGAAERSSASTTVPWNVTSQAKRCVLELHHHIANDGLLGSDAPLRRGGDLRAKSSPIRCQPVDARSVAQAIGDHIAYLDQVIAHASLTPFEAVSGQRCDPRARASAHEIRPEASDR